MKYRAAFRSAMPKLTSMIKFLEAAARDLEQQTNDPTRAICLLAQAGMTSRAITEVLRDYKIAVHYTTVARIIKRSEPELPI